jgi:two-component system, NtrC family, sensor kinase
VTDSQQNNNEFQWDLAAESITVRVRWIGLGVGYVLVNLTSADYHQHAAFLNAILTIGAVYAAIDSVWSYRGRVFLNRTPLVISLMEAVFIGLLCYFDVGPESSFRFYYFLSLIVCAIRYSPKITYSTFGLHALSFTILAISHQYDANQLGNRDDLNTLVLYLILMGWVTWAGTALAGLMKRAERQLSQLNEELKRNQTLLEERISERTQELQQSQALLVQQEKQAAFGLLAAGIAHEVGNPLAAISSLVQMLNRKHTDDYTRERLQMVDDQLLRIQRTLRELVDFSRPATNEPTLCDVHEAINAALNIAKYYKRRKGKKILTKYQSGLPRLRVVRDQLVQVFLNLILNAMDATAEGSSIQLTTEWIDGWIAVAVIDDGHGIPDENRDAIFQPYVTTKSTGTGLGLFVCKNLIEEMDFGRIELTESSPAGTTFTVSLSCKNVRDHYQQTQSPVYSTEEVKAT